MGSSICRFDIELDSDVGQNEIQPLMAGSVVQGKVVVHVSRPITLKPQQQPNAATAASASASASVQLELYGKEKVRMNKSKAKRTAGSASSVNHQSSSSSVSSASLSKVAERRFLHLTMQWPAFPDSGSTNDAGTTNGTNDTTLTVYRPNHPPPTTTATTANVIQPGTHVFPFQIQLPTSLPSSTYYPKHDNRARSKLNFRIQYKIVASLYMNGSAIVPPTTPSFHANNSNTTTTPPPRTTAATRVASRYLWIASVTPLPVPDPVPCMVQPIAQEITNTGGWWSKGQFWFGASLSNCKVVLSPPPLAFSPSAAATTNTTIAASNNSRPTACHPQTTANNSNNNAILALHVPREHSAVPPPLADDTLELHVACRNDSTAPIQRVQISVLERLTWNTWPVQTVDRTTGHCHTSAVYQQTQTNCLLVLNHIPLVGLVKEKPVAKGLLHSVVETVFGTDTSNSVWRSNAAGTKEEQLQRQIYHDLVVGEHPIHLTLPPDTRPSFQGDLIQVTHIVKMEFHTAAFTKTPVLEIPIQVLGPPSSTCHWRRHQPTLPSGAGDAYFIPPPAAAVANSAKPQAEATSTCLVVTTTAVPTSKKPLLSAVTGVDGADASSTSDTATAAPSTTSTTSHSDVEVIELPLVRRPVPYIGRKAPPVASPLPTPSAERPFQVTSLAHLVPLSAPLALPRTTTKASRVSVSQLMTELRASMNEFELVMEKLLEPEWVALFQCLTPEEYGTVVSGVHEFDQPRVAVVLASHVNQTTNEGGRGGGGEGLTSEYIAALLRVASTNHRAVLTQKLLPLCRDAREHGHLILNELNGWEQTVTEQAMLLAMQ